MIPKPLNEIEWSDIEALKDSGREEDDTIEYKARFSGGSDYLAFNDSQQIKAVGGIAREAVAFLNGRGGDIVIGVQEAANDHTKIEAITPVGNIDQTVDRLAQSLAALIEPSQSVLSLRAIRQAEGDLDGVIVVRCPSSLRAPHRFKTKKECYVRRGRSSVPMPMDEIQDMTLRRADMMTARLKVLDSQFSDISSTIVGRQTLPAHRIHIRTCFVPASVQQIDLGQEVLNAFRGSDPTLALGDENQALNVAFRPLNYDYRPILRGMSCERLFKRNHSESDFSYCSKLIRSDGLFRTDYALRLQFSDQNSDSENTGFYHPWIIGYLANTLSSFAAVQKLCPTLGSGLLRVAIYCSGPITMRFRESWEGLQLPWPDGTVAIPDFEIDTSETLMKTFHQLQLDIASIPGFPSPEIYSFISE